MNDENKKMAMVKVDVCGAELEAGKEGETVWVSVKKVCESLGLKMQGQHAKLIKKPWAVIKMILTTGPDGKAYKTFCISLRSLTLWLVTISPSKSTALNLKTRLERFQKEAADVLADHFLGKLSQTSVPKRKMPKAERRARLVLRLLKGLSPVATRQRDELLLAAANELYPARVKALLEAPSILGHGDSLDGAQPGDDAPGAVPSEEEREVRDRIHDKWEADGLPEIIEVEAEVLPEANAEVEGWSLRGLLERFKKVGMGSLTTGKIRTAAKGLDLIGDTGYGHQSTITVDGRRVVSRQWRYNEEAALLLEQTLRMYMKNIAGGLEEKNAMAVAVAMVGKRGSGARGWAPLRVIRAPE